MKASRFSEAQKTFILKQGADGMAIYQMGNGSCPHECTGLRPVSLANLYAGISTVA